MHALKGEQIANEQSDIHVKSVLMINLIKRKIHRSHESLEVQCIVILVPGNCIGIPYILTGAF